MNHSLILAQFLPPAEIAAWLACATFTTMLFNQLALARANLLEKKSRHEISPDPLNVRPVSDAVTERICLGRHAGLEKQMDEMRSDRKAEANALHEKVNGVAREVSELAAAAGLQNQRLAQIDAKLDRVIERQTS
jgi:hypothetical protein